MIKEIKIESEKSALQILIHVSQYLTAANMKIIFVIFRRFHSSTLMI